MEQTTVESQTLSSPIRYSDKTHSPLPPCKKKIKKIPTPTQKLIRAGSAKINGIINISLDKHSSYKPSSYAEKGVKADKFKSSKLLDATKCKM
jgi:hypothetical protein